MMCCRFRRRWCRTLLGVVVGALAITQDAAAARLDEYYYNAFARVDVFRSQDVPSREAQQQESAFTPGTGRDFALSAQLNNPPDAHFAAAGWQGTFQNADGDSYDPGIGGSFQRLRFRPEGIARVDFDGSQSAGTDAMAFGTANGQVTFTVDMPTEWRFDGIYRLAVVDAGPDASVRVGLSVLRVDADTTQTLYHFEATSPSAGDVALNATGELAAGTYRVAVNGSGYTGYVIADGAATALLRGDFTLTPVPEPAAVGLLLPCAALLGRRRRRVHPTHTDRHGVFLSPNATGGPAPRVFDRDAVG